MSAPPLNDVRDICRILLTGEGRWVCLAASLGDLAPEGRFLSISESLSYELEGLDELARKYGLANWQGGVISGARYAFRALKAPLQQVRLHELRGQLGSGDVSAVSSAAAIAVAHLLDRSQEFSVDLTGWKLETEVGRPRTPAEGGTSGSPEAILSVPQSGQKLPVN